jgi:hypothetical protein
LLLAFALMLVVATAVAAPQPKVTICHKYGTPAEKTMEVAFPAAMIGHVQDHGDFLGACPESDLFIDVDGIATADRGLPGGINVMVGDLLTAWPTGFWNEGLDWFDNDATCTWTFGDDLHLEDPQGACTTGLRDGLHNVGSDCDLLDLDGSFFDGQSVDVDLETGSAFTGCSGPDPLLMFYDTNGNSYYDNGEDIVLDLNGNGVFD